MHDFIYLYKVDISCVIYAINTKFVINFWKYKIYFYKAIYHFLLENFLMMIYKNLYIFRIITIKQQQMIIKLLEIL